jgi:hypothetical protein
MTTTDLITTTDAVIAGVPMMDAIEARETIDLMSADMGMVVHYADSFRRRALDFRDREGWKALGYAGYVEAIQAELGAQYSKSYISRLLQAAEIEQVLELPIGNNVPESVLREVAKATTPDQQRAAYQAATVDGPATAKNVRQAVSEISETDLPPEYDIIKRRLSAHGIALLSNMQGHHRAYVTRKEGMTGVVTFTWADVLSKLERLEATPDPDPAGAAFRMTCPTCGETILNGIWGDLKECGSCYHARQQQPTAPAAPTLADLDATLPADLHKLGYFWRSATPPTIESKDGWRGDAPTVDGAIVVARTHKDAKGEPLTIFPALTPLECKALLREAKQFIASGLDKKLPTIGQALRIAARMALEATE